MPTVLVADDDASVRLLMRRILESEGHIVLEAEDGRDALDVINAHKPDVSLIDVRMPRVDGFGLLRELANRGEHRVLLVTGAVDEEDFLKGWGLGADGYIAKPFEPEDLLAAVLEVVGLTPEQRAVRREREMDRARLLRQLDRFMDDGGLD